MLPIGQLLWEKELMSYKEFPPMQAPETYNLDGILKAMQQPERPVTRAIAARREESKDVGDAGGPGGSPAPCAPLSAYHCYIQGH